jgi:hypothetical protein
MTHVPLLRAKVSTIHRYNVGKTIGNRVLVNGNPRSNWCAKVLEVMSSGLMREVGQILTKA